MVGPGVTIPAWSEMDFQSGPDQANQALHGNSDSSGLGTGVTVVFGRVSVCLLRLRFFGPGQHHDVLEQRF